MKSHNYSESFNYIPKEGREKGKEEEVLEDTERNDGPVYGGKGQKRSKTKSDINLNNVKI